MGITTKINISRDLRIALIVLAILCLLPLGLHNNPYVMHILIMCFIWGVLASSWELTNQYAGIFNLAQTVFFIAGAYMSAMMALYWGISPWLGLLLGGIVGGAVGIAVALPSLRVKGVYTALLTFALTLIIDPMIRRTEAWGTGGSEGLHAIPAFQLGGYVFTPLEKVPPYYVALAIFSIAAFVLYKVIRSRVGLAFVALRDAGPFAKSLGVSEFRYKLMAFGIAASLSGVAGAFYAHYTRTLSPTAIGLDVFLVVLLMMMIGGGRFPGAIIAAFALTFANEFLRATGTLRPIILGAVIISMIVLRPGGIMGIIDSIRYSIRQRASRAELPASKSSPGKGVG